MVRPEFNMHVPAGVSLLCFVSPQWLVASNTEFWWKKVAIAQYCTV